MGTLVKRHLAKQLGLDPAQIYHCAVMPCYDKKLEGSRDDFMIPGTAPQPLLLDLDCMSSAAHCFILYNMLLLPLQVLSLMRHWVCYVSGL